MLIIFKNRETTASNGRLPQEISNFTSLNMLKYELDLIYDSIRYEIGSYSRKNLYAAIEVYINLMLDLEDIFEEIKTKYTNYDDYLFQIPVHLLELGYLLQAVKDYGTNLDKNAEKPSDKSLIINQLAEKLSSAIRDNYTTLKKIFCEYDKNQRLQLLKDIWNNLYELTDI